MGQGEKLERPTREASRGGHGRPTTPPKVQIAEGKGDMGDSPKVKQTPGVRKEKDSGAANPTGPHV